MCDIGDAESPKIYRNEIRKARKTHICCECGSVIEVGELYDVFTGLWDRFMTYKTCLFCIQVRATAHVDMGLKYDESIPFEQLWECVGMDYMSR